MGTTLSDYRPADRARRTRTGRALYGRALTLLLGVIWKRTNVFIMVPTGH